MFYEIKKRLQIDLFSSNMVTIDEGGAHWSLSGKSLGTQVFDIWRIFGIIDNMYMGIYKKPVLSITSSGEMGF